MAKIKKIVFSFTLFALIVLSILPVSAYTIKTLPSGSAEGGFALSASKIELVLNPGETTVRNITVTNRIGKESKFKVGIEDFGPSDQPNELTKLYGSETGPYSLKQYLTPELNEFTLKQGKQITLAIAVSIPSDASPGGLYGSVLVSNIPEITNSEDEKIESKVGLSSRLGVLFFVKINGETKQSGSLISFNPSKIFYTSVPVKLKYVFNNDGNIYLAPKGNIVIKNIFNLDVDKIKIDPFFVLPKTSRVITEEWIDKFMLGYYTATLNLERGYNGNIDTKTISFWVIPIPVIVIAVAVILILIIMRGKRKKKRKTVKKKKLRRKFE